MFDKLIHHEEYNLSVDGMQLIVRDGVFAPDPRITYSPFMILNNLPSVEDKDTLDMGTGTGIIAFALAKRKARRVVAADISELAIENARQNIRNQPIEVVCSDLYQNIQGEFDYIFANLPIVPEYWNMNTVNLTQRFLEESKGHLKKDGEIYLTWFSMADPKQARDMIRGSGYQWREVSEVQLGFTWYLFKIKEK